MDAIEQLDVILGDLVALGRNTTPEQLANPSPCTAFDVRGVMNHMTGGGRFFAAQFRGEPGAGVAAVAAEAMPGYPPDWKPLTGGPFTAPSGFPPGIDPTFLTDRPLTDTKKTGWHRLCVGGSILVFVLAGRWSLIASFSDSTPVSPTPPAAASPP